MKKLLAALMIVSLFAVTSCGQKCTIDAIIAEVCFDTSGTVQYCVLGVCESVDAADYGFEEEVTADNIEQLCTDAEGTLEGGVCN